MMTARQEPSPAGALLCCGAATLLLVLTGCGTAGGNDAKHPEASASPAPEAEVLAAYDAMGAEQVKAYRAASAEGTALKRYAARAALDTIEADLVRLSSQGAVMRGDLVHEPAVSGLALGARPPTATVTDCVDASRWQILDTATGWRIPPPADRPVRYEATARVERTDTGRWTVTEYTAHTARSC